MARTPTSRRAPAAARVRRPGRVLGDGDRGAASVLAVGIVGAVVALTAMVVPIATTFVASQRAANAADAAALAAADAISGLVPGVACELARQVAGRNGAALTSCQTDGAVVTVGVVVSSLGMDLGARARAGPPGYAG
ncbi:Rv3654c family TadE-like protein [Agromyces sp. Soil535]|uniref:Rv3654c family TadE-like protein n=1 Tax=Agromyces sp. Soil535 TaxID=1736390 RepID=UPI0009E9CAC8|nr:Rv3654c family TadE-like protein [Agromyces sp. Soil535]